MRDGWSRSRSSRAYAVALLFWASLGSACVESRDRGLSPEERARWQRDSIAYDSAMAIWRHDSSVIDSLAASVPTRRLGAGYVRMLNDSSSAAAMLQLTCEEWRLGSRYGERALRIAEARVAKHVFDSASAANGWRVDESALHPRTVRVGVAICHDSILHPETTYHGVNVDRSPPLPAKPRRPH